MTMIARPAPQKRDPYFLVGIVGIAFLLFVCIRITQMSPQNNDAATTKFKSSPIYTSLQDVISNNGDYDAIFVLGGGVPLSLYEPPLYVQQRCDDAAAVRLAVSSNNDIPILTLSAGTAHLAQLLTPQGLPVWEATSSAAYLQQKHNIRTNLYLETTSYDTIGNAFFARISHADIVGWRKILIITNEFHMERTKAIFDWIFGIDAVDGGDSKTKRRSSKQIRSKNNYHLTYFASPNVGLTEEALQARRIHEEKSTETIRTKLAPQYQTLPDLWKFINQNHDLYTANKLITGATQVASVRNDALKASYGAAAGATLPEVKDD